MAESEWTWWENPTDPGWYAETHCWDGNEGMFPGARKWDGAKWDEDLPFLAFAGPFTDRETALQWAYDHDMEGV